MTFCTQCGTQLQEGQACPCTEEKQFCTECGTKLNSGQACTCTAAPEPVPVHTPAPIEDNVPQIYSTYHFHSNLDTAQAAHQGGSENAETGINPMAKIPDVQESAPHRHHAETDAKPTPVYVGSISEDEPVRQYNIAELRNWVRAPRSHGHIQVTSRRVIFSAEGRGADGHGAVYKEMAVNEIIGFDAVNNHRFSIAHLIIGLVVVLAAAMLAAAVTFVGGWAITTLFVSRPPMQEFLSQSIRQVIDYQVIEVSQLSLIFGLFVGFGGVALYVILRQKFMFRLMMLGVSLGAFFVVALTGNTFAYTLSAAALLINMYGLIMFARLSDLVVIVHGRGGACINMIRGQGFMAAVLGRIGTGYAEAAPAPEANAAINELCAVINDIQNQGDVGVKKWMM